MTSLEFLFEQGPIFAVYKPAGIHSVRLPGGAGGASIADLLIAARPGLTHAGRSPEDGGLVHRLDFSTSGVLLGASTRAAWDELYGLLLRGEAQKEYIACVEGHVTHAITISSFIGSPYRGAKKMKSFESDPGARARALPGTTLVRPLSYNPTKNLSLISAAASPARRHQVRLHAASCGHPLVGDTLYGSVRSAADIVAAPRDFFLHSWRISLLVPSSGSEIAIESPYERELQWHAPHLPVT